MDAAQLQFLNRAKRQLQSAWIIVDTIKEIQQDKYLAITGPAEVGKDTEPAATYDREALSLEVIAGDIDDCINALHDKFLKP